MPLPSQRSYRCRSAVWICSEKPILAPSTRATSQWLAAHLRNSATPPKADLAICAALVMGALSACATRIADAMSRDASPSWSRASAASP